MDRLIRSTLGNTIPKASRKEGSMNELSACPAVVWSRMVGEEVALSAANPEPGVRIAPHPAPQCTVSFNRDTFLL